ncbi:armadillo-type protein [Filobasidium floriforme]|uniref:armadillo-type protein n=1 Tax=Filobasidium floriforme TaxID=5210 RepID=UPI001E8E903E|nr:armadillo-type protein [Filobasidium floriforme]KAH8090375.1 armadillo-type protein [Filobasidium floriforme]
MARQAKLEFEGKISAKGASTDGIRARLKELHEKLKALNQDETDISSLEAVRKQLIEKSILLNKDKGIKAYCACCLADMLRLYAPDPPYKDERLKDIFVFMLTQVSHHLKAQSSFPTTSRSRAPTTTRMTDIPYYSEYYYLLDSLATIRSICLVIDLSGGEELAKDWFIGLFSIVRSDMNKQMLRLLQDILTSLLDESGTLPVGLLENVLLAQISAHKENPAHPAFMLTVGIMRNSAPKLQRQLHAYIADIHDTRGKDPSDDDMGELREAHSMLCLLFAHAPEVLLNVIPYLEEALQGGSLQLRVLTTETLGAIFGSPSGATIAPVGNLTIAESYHSTWQMWMGRRADKAIQVRVAWVGAARNVLVHHPELRSSVEVGLVEKFTDVEDRVRAAACRALGSLDYEVAAHHVSVGTLKMLGDRLKDKKPAVSERAFEALGRLYAAAYNEIEAGDSAAIAQFGWIPESIYKSLADNASITQREHVETVTADYILPLPSLKADPDAETHWVDRLLVVCCGLSASAFESLMSLTNLSDPALQPWEVYVKACEANNGGVIDRDEEEVKKRLEQIIKYLAGRFVEPHRTEKALQSFASLNDTRLYKHINAMVNLSTDIEGVIKARSDALKRLDSSLPDAVPVFKILFNKASFWIINRSSISLLINRATKQDSDDNSVVAHKILLHISKQRAQLFSTHVAELQSLLTDKRPNAPVDLALQCLAQTAMVSPKDTNLPNRIIERLNSFCAQGTALQGKYAARMLARSSNANDVEQAVMASIQALDGEASPTPLLAPLCALREFIKRNVDAIKPKVDSIVDRLNARVLSEVVEPAATDERWRKWEELDERSQTKVLALKVQIEVCLMGLPGVIEVQARHREGVKALHRVIASAGQIDEEPQESGALAGHLRLVAATGLTKMAHYREYEEMISSACFEEIAYQIQDEYYPVRYGYLQKLHKYLLRRRHAPRWYILPFLVAHDVEQDVKDMGIKITQDVQHRLPDKQRVTMIEKPFVRLLSLLAHHPDFETTGADDLIAMSQYINLYLDEVANQRNVTLLYYLANRIKTVQDIKESGDRLYLLSELAQLLLQQRAQAQQWSIDQYSGKHNMPSDIFARLPNSDVSKEIARKQYLTADMARELQASTARKPAKPLPIEKPPKVAKPPKERITPVKPTPKRKRRRTPDSGDDTAGEETPDTDDYEEQSGDEMVRIKPKAKRAGRSNPRVRDYHDSCLGKVLS